MKYWAVALLLALAGCLGEGATQSGGDETGQDAEELSYGGQVLSPTFVPLVGVAVELSDGNSTSTDNEGKFILRLPPGNHSATLRLDGFQNSTVELEQSLNATYTLTPMQPLAFSNTVPFNGILQCGAEYLIITGSCDTGSTTFGGPGVFTQENLMEVQLDAEWQTIVVDVVFDLADHPGIEKLRLVGRAIDGGNALLDYEQFGRFSSETSFTQHFAPDQNYPDGDTPLDGNATDFQFEVYPQGYAYHTTCDPVTGQCPLGVGAALDLKFELYVTAFYGSPAEPGWSVQ